MCEITCLPQSFEDGFQLSGGNLPVPGAKLFESVLLGEHRLLTGGYQTAIDTNVPQNPISMQNQRFLAWVLTDPRVGVVCKGWIEHVVDVHEFVTTVASEGRIIKSSRNQLDANTFEALLFELLCQVVFDRAPFA